MHSLASGRRWPQPLTLSTKVSLAAIVVVSSVIGFFLVEGIREQKILLADAARGEAESKARLLRASLEDPRLWENAQALQAFLHRLPAPRADGLTSRIQFSQNPEQLEILILDADGTVIAANVAEDVGKKYTRDPRGEIGLTMEIGRAHV